MEQGNVQQPSQQTDSLVRRLAGASVTKAGLALDQSEINRIIAEVSKGSKFYENEKRKDKDLTERIEKLLKQRDDAVKGVDLHKIEVMVDQMIEKMESERDLSQLIVHVDMDAFYANVELLHNPDLKGKPFGVGRGVLTTASYDARKYGVRSGMATFVAKALCPQLIIVSNHFHLYSEMSRQVMDIFRRYDETMCPAGSDEAYLNVTEYCESHYITVDECVSEMRQAVFDETKLTVSAGIAPNKMLAKICSDKNKPNGQYKLEFEAEHIRNFMSSLPIRKVPGVGRVNERLLESMGIQTCGDIYKHRALLHLMDKQFGLTFLLRTYLGIASNHVQPYAREERKSIGAERTFQPIGDRQRILGKLEEISEELERDMDEEGWTGKTVTLKFKLDTYQVFTRAKSFNHWVTKKEELFSTGKELLLPEFPLKIRLIGLRVTKLKDLRAAKNDNTGIKRFFNQVQPNQDGASPRKKRKLEHDPHQLEGQDDDEGDDEGDDEDVMPGFHEHDETLNLEVAEDEDMPVAGPSKPRPRPPVSAPACSPPIKPPTESVDIPHPEQQAKARAKSTGPEPRNPQQVADGQPDSPSPPTLECPICHKQLQTDNSGLNAHIDWCLSRGAIWDAQAETVVSTPSSNTKRGANEKGKVSKAEKGKSERGSSSKGTATKKPAVFNWGKSKQEKGY